MPDPRRLAMRQIPFTTRFLVRVQLAPWRWLSVFVLVELGVVFGGEVLRRRYRPVGETLPFEALLAIFALVWLFPILCRHLTHGARGALERLAWFLLPWMGVAVAIVVFKGANPPSTRVMMEGVAIGLAPCVWAWLSWRAFRADRCLPLWLCAIVVVLGVVLPATFVGHGNDAEVIWALSLLAGTVIVDHLALTQRPRLDGAIACAAVLVVVVLHALHLGLNDLPEALVLIAVGSVLVFIARRARRLTVVPVGHPIYTHFGGPSGE